MGQKGSIVKNSLIGICASTLSLWAVHASAANRCLDIFNGAPATAGSAAAHYSVGVSGRVSANGTITGGGLGVNAASSGAAATGSDSLTEKWVKILESKAGIAEVNTDSIRDGIRGLRSPLAARFVGPDFERCAAQWTHPKSVSALGAALSAAADTNSVEEASQIAVRRVATRIYPHEDRQTVVQDRVCPAMHSNGCNVLKLGSVCGAIN